MAANTREAVLRLLLKAPPGQLKNVYGDIKGITGIGDELAESARNTIEQHNHEQLAVAQISVDGADVPAIIAAAARTPSGRYVVRRIGRSFAYGHVNETVSEIQPHAEHSGFAKQLDKQLVKYAEDHYETGASGVFFQGETDVQADASEGEPAAKDDAADAAEAQDTATGDTEVDKDDAAADEDKKESADAAVVDEAPGEARSGADDAAAAAASPLTIHIVGNRYNLRNFWAGQWRSSYVFDTTSRTFTKAQIQVRVHYFENGNVQLDTRNEAVEGLDLSLTEDAPADATAKALVEAIAKHEQAYHESLYNTIDALRERAFKGLRRTLPITRQKIDWEQAASYKLGNELANR